MPRAACVEITRTPNYTALIHLFFNVLVDIIGRFPLLLHALPSAGTAV
jgi:hypothetical protein